MAVKIITDSLGDIPSEVAEELGITIIPLSVLFSVEAFRDGIDLNTEQFYDKLIRNKVYPTPTIPSLSTFVELYNRVAKETDEVMVITVSGKLSGVYDSAVRAIEKTEGNCRIEVIDSQWAVMAQGLIVIAAARAAKAGASLDEVVNITRKNIPRAEVRMAFTTLEYLKQGGRIGKAQAFLGPMLKVHSILSMRESEVYPLARERSRTRAIDYLYDFATSYARIEEIAVEDATTPDQANRLVKRLSAKFPDKHIYQSKVSPVIGAHVGPDVLGVAVLGDK